MYFINSQYKTVELIKEDKYGCEYLVQDIFKDNMLKRMRVIDYSPETKDFIEYMKVNYYDYQNLIHPNIAEFYYFNRIRDINAKPVVSNKFYYTYEHYKGENIFSYSKNKDFDTLLDLAAQLCSAFQFIHLRGLLFFDISGDQIDVVNNNNESQVKISSFCYKNSIQESVPIDGKDLYFEAPEVLQYSRYTKQSDIYMLGVILFHIFTDTPFEGSSFMDRLEKIVYSNQPNMDRIIDIVKKCTYTEISDRYKFVDEIIDDINRSFNKSFKIVDKKYIETFPVYPTTLVARETYIKYIIDSIHNYFYECSELKAAIITGRPGTGKEAFLYALHNRVLREGEYAVYLNLQQTAYEKYYVITELIKGLSKYASKELIDKYSESLCYIIPEFISNSAVVPFYAKDEETEKHKLTYRLGNFILETSLKQPIIFILKGYEHIDAASKDVIYYIMRNHSRGKIFYVMSFENIDVQDQIRDYIAQLMGEDAVGGIQLSNLNFDETAELIKILLGMEYAPVNFVYQIYKETDGNPYAIHEIIYSLYVDKYIFVNEKGQWVFDNIDLSKLDLDVSSDEMLQNKINKLESKKREILDVISVFKSAASCDLVQSMLEMSGEEIMPLLDSMITTNILSRRIDEWGIYVDFISSALKRSIYAQLNDLTKYKYHEKASHILEHKLYAENKQNKDELIFQLTKSGKCDEAINYITAASEEAMKKGLIK